MKKITDQEFDEKWEENLKDLADEGASISQFGSRGLAFIASLAVEVGIPKDAFIRMLSEAYDVASSSDGNVPLWPGKDSGDLLN